MHSLGVGWVGTPWVCLLLGHTPLPDADSEPPQVITALHIIIAVVLGAFAGLLAGLLLARLVAFAAYLFGKEFEGRALVILATIAGGGAGAWWVLRC